MSSSTKYKDIMERQKIQQVIDTIFGLWEHRLWYGINDEMASKMIQEIMDLLYDDKEPYNRL